MFRIFLGHDCLDGQELYKDLDTSFCKWIGVIKLKAVTACKSAFA